MIKTFTHRFQGGTSCTLRFDLTTDEPRLSANLSLKNCTEAEAMEYKIWMQTVVLDEVLSVCNRKQARYFIKHGIKVMRQLSGAVE